MYILKYIYIYTTICVFLYLHINIHSTHILCKHKLLFWMQLIMINRFDSTILNEHSIIIPGGKFIHLARI